jgi:hypothetical protein
MKNSWNRILVLKVLGELEMRFWREANKLKPKDAASRFMAQNVGKWDTTQRATLDLRPYAIDSRLHMERITNLLILVPQPQHFVGRHRNGGYYTRYLTNDIEIGSAGIVAGCAHDQG